MNHEPNAASQMHFHRKYAPRNSSTRRCLIAQSPYSRAHNQHRNRTIRLVKTLLATFLTESDESTFQPSGAARVF